MDPVEQIYENLQFSNGLTDISEEGTDAENKQTSGLSLHSIEEEESYPSNQTE
jgi:hypothetical protein